MNVDNGIKRGVVLVAFGQLYRDLAVVCARYLKRSNPDLPIHLYTDEFFDCEDIDDQILLKDPWAHSKLDGLLQTQFEETLYLDVDAFCILPVDDLFEVLGSVDIALCHDQWRNGAGALNLFDIEIPNSFPQLNGGLIVYRRCAEVLELFQKWRDMLLKSGAKKDQPALREVLYLSDIRFNILPGEYNIHHKHAFAPHRNHTAPRVMHFYQFHSEPIHVKTGAPIFHFLGPVPYLMLLRSIRMDNYLIVNDQVPEYALTFEGWNRKVARLLLIYIRWLWTLPESWRLRLSFLIPRSIELV